MFGCVRVYLCPGSSVSGQVSCFGRGPCRFRIPGCEGSTVVWMMQVSPDTCPQSPMADRLSKEICGAGQKSFPRGGGGCRRSLPKLRLRIGLRLCRGGLASSGYIQAAGGGGCSRSLPKLRLRIGLRLCRGGLASSGYIRAAGLCGDGTSPPQFCRILDLDALDWKESQFRWVDDRPGGGKVEREMESDCVSSRDDKRGLFLQDLST